MFIILSQATFETSTDLVCKWLEYYNVNYRRINGEDFFKINEFKLNKELNHISLIWYRRRISGSPIEISFKNNTIGNNKTMSILKTFCIDEFRELYTFFLNGFNTNNFINNPSIIENLKKVTRNDLKKLGGGNAETEGRAC